MSNRYWQILIMGTLALLVIFFVPRKDAPTTVVSDFESCVEAGGVVKEGLPVTCTSLDGQVFSEEDAGLPEVVVDTPQFGEVVTSPLIVSGRARGFWFFEANLPVVLKDQNGKVLAAQGFQADGEWMTTEFVEFSGVLEFNTPETDFGVLIISKDNPSGLEEFDASMAVPVRFK